jgi:hypothetical protein
MILGAIAAASLVYFYAHHVGYAKRDQEMQLEIARLNDEARDKEQKLAENLNQTSSQLKEANDVVTKKQTDLDAAIRSGRVRLNSSCVQTATSAATASGNSQEAGSKSNGQANASIDEQERQTLAAIAEIIAQGDRNTAQLNACIDAYNAVREQINSQAR